MIAIDRISAVLLCAGLSTRHAAGCKLMRALNGQPLVAHAAGLLRSLPFQSLIAVVPPRQANPALHDLLSGLGFELAENSRREDGQDSSVRLGIARARRDDPAALLLCLGDMPYVEADHLASMVAAAEPDRTVASAGPSWRSPPALFPRRYLGAIADGTASPRQILASDETAAIAAPAGSLIDFDRAEDFEKARKGATCLA